MVPVRRSQSRSMTPEHVHATPAGSKQLPSASSSEDDETQFDVVRPHGPEPDAQILEHANWLVPLLMRLQLSLGGESHQTSGTSPVRKLSLSHLPRRGDSDESEREREQARVRSQARQLGKGTQLGQKCSTQAVSSEIPGHRAAWRQ